MITNWKVWIEDCTNLTKYISISVSALQITPAPDTDLLFGLEEVIYLLLQVGQLQLHCLLSLDGCRGRKLKVLQLKPVQVSSLLLKAKNGIHETVNRKTVWKQDDLCFFPQTYEIFVKTRSILDEFYTNYKKQSFVRREGQLITGLKTVSSINQYRNSFRLWGESQYPWHWVSWSFIQLYVPIKRQYLHSLIICWRKKPRSF